MSDIKATDKEIIGSWRLTSYLLKMENGETIPLWGENTDGIIIYLENGYMSVHVSDEDRPKFAENDFLRGNEEELKRAFEGYTCYFGKYEYSAEKGVVYHYVAQSVYPNWSGVTHTRYVEINDEKLLITTPPIKVGGKECIMEMRWSRV